MIELFKDGTMGSNSVCARGIILAISSNSVRDCGEKRNGRKNGPCTMAVDVGNPPIIVPQGNGMDNAVIFCHGSKNLRNIDSPDSQLTQVTMRRQHNVVPRTIVTPIRDDMSMALHENIPVTDKALVMTTLVLCNGMNHEEQNMAGSMLSWPRLCVHSR